jgi:hypothetical protein
VGIGIASPQVKLDVSGTTNIFRLTGGSASNATYATFYNGSADQTYFGIENNVGGGIIGSGTAYSTILSTVSTTPLVFGTNAAERARIDSSGNLLVGTTSVVDFGFLTLKYNGTTSNGIVFSDTSNSGTTNACAFKRNSTTSVGAIQLTTTTTAYVTSSDYRLKHDIQPMTGALAKVAQLKPVTYKWNADDSNGEGFIAHELQEVAPYAVSGEKDGEEMQGVDYGKITPLLTAALQEAIAKIETLEARISALEAK